MGAIILPGDLPKYGYVPDLVVGSIGELTHERLLATFSRNAQERAAAA